MKLTVLGCGNAFGTGGRLQTSFHVCTGDTQILIDCGATALIGMAKAGLDPARVSTILVSHLHGDHFAGLVWWLLHTKYIAKRTEPLTLVGPPGLAQRLKTATEALYAGTVDDFAALNIRFVELAATVASKFDTLAVTPYEVVHPSGAPSYALRIETPGRTIAFSGDTEWTPVLKDAAQGADLFICECSTADQPVPSHMNWITLKEHLPALGAKRVMLTHMNNAMFALREELVAPNLIFAEDGLELAV